MEGGSLAAQDPIHTPYRTTLELPPTVWQTGRVAPKLEREEGGDGCRYAWCVERCRSLILLRARRDLCGTRYIG